jgi:hypothetical protein
LAENRISVHTALRNPHPYVGKTMLAFKGKKPEGQIAQGSEAEKWLTWASQQADRFDPLTKSPLSILDDVV